jgi:hypothetical protein
MPVKLGQAFFGAALLASGAATAASLENAAGDVRVSRGKGFAAVGGSAQLLPGDKIKVGRKGAARLVYPDGCGVNVRANSLMTVAKQSPCSFSARASDWNDLELICARDNPSDPRCCAPEYARENPLDPVCGDPWPVLGGLAGLGAMAGVAVAAQGSQHSTATGFFPPISSASP